MTAKAVELVYVDTSVFLAYLQRESVAPRDEFWSLRLCTSRLTEYEALTRLHQTGDEKAVEACHQLLARVRFLELSPVVLQRARQPWPTHVRTLDALHLASVLYLQNSVSVRLATYDKRMAETAVALETSLYPL